MKVFFQFSWLIKVGCMMALATALPMTSVTQAQQTVVSTTVAAPINEQSLTFEYLFFWKENDAQTQNVLASTQQELDQLGGNVSLKQIGIKDPANAKVVAHYGVSRAPMPLVLCTASNGAVTKAFVSPFPAAQLREGIVSRGTAQTLKAIQDNKLVVLCTVNSVLPASGLVLQNAQALLADERFAKSVEVIAVDTRDPNEASLLADVKLAANMTEPAVVILAPPGKQLGTLAGAVTTSQIAEKLVAAQTACCPGGQCGTGAQCCPGGQCAPPQK